MILHIVHDEKFIDLAYRVFEEANPLKNEYVILSRPSNLKYIKKAPVNFVDKKDFHELYAKLYKYEMVIVHCLTEAKVQFLAGIEEQVKIVWIGWGCDYYDLITGDVAKTFNPKTLELYSKNRLGFFQVLSRNLRKECAKIFKGVKDKRDVLSKIKFFSPVLHQEFLLLKNKMEVLDCEYLSWNYGTLEDDFISGYEDISVDGDNILLGNSATYTNNHLDLLESLSKKDLNHSKIICPLSYGNMEYRKDIILSGRSYFGDTFVPLTSFMPGKEYISFISSCSIVLMGHQIQQGLGNIITMLHMGAKVFLDSRNPIFSFFKEQGAYIYSLNDFDEEVETRLTDHQIEFNRALLRKHWSREVIVNKTKKLIKYVRESSPISINSFTDLESKTENFKKKAI